MRIVRPWYHETPGPGLINEWTITHVLWGMASAKYLSWWPALALHTLYEMAEGSVFPRANRDVSTMNHVGDTLTFLVGRWLAERAAQSGVPQ